MRPHYSNILTSAEKCVVLVGAGAAHLVFLRQWRMAPVPDVTVTLVSEDATILYSAMVPGLIAREYREEEATIDLVRFCASAGVRFLHARATRLDAAARKLHLEGRRALGYDFLSLALGGVMKAPPNTLPLRPLSALCRFPQEMLSEEIERVAVVGGGASGTEVAIALRARFPAAAVTLYHDGPTIERDAGSRLRRSRVTLRLGVRATGEEPADAIVWATSVAAPRFFRDSGLPVDGNGFLRVERSLRVPGTDGVFGAGDAVSVEGLPRLARSGVVAVRQGLALWKNFRRWHGRRALRPFRAPVACLYLLNGGDGVGLLRFGPLRLRGRWVRRWKEAIDRKWIAGFVPPPMTGTAMECGGCAAKVPGEVLRRVLGGLTAVPRDEVLLGLEAREDAVVLLPRRDRVEVQTADFFPAFIDDIYRFGRIAAVHALSDLYAMNAAPVAAQAVVALPSSSPAIQEERLAELLSGANDALCDAGVALVGGHSSLGAELGLGFFVTGQAEPGRLFRKSGLAAGQALVLTKPIGSGALLAAWRQGACRAEWLEALLRQLETSNSAAAAVFAAAEIGACTDVTGFGLAGHLLEMCRASAVSAEIEAGAVPLYDGFVDVTAAGIRSSAYDGNFRYAGLTGPEWLFDPQTSGGLLAGVPHSHVDEVLAALAARGVAGKKIGQVVASANTPALRVS